ETGLEVETAEDGDHALDRLKSGRFDLLLSDVQMPGRVLGDALARTALSQGYVQAAILLSGNPDSNSLKEAERSDRLRLLLKPLRREALVSHVQEMLAAHCSAPRSSTPS
ncbi:MAG: response regulator, partial [Myxococcota bacterium]